MSSALCLVAWSLIFLLKNERPESIQMTNVDEKAWGRYVSTMRYAWVAFLPPFCYGFLESSLNALFPVYALRLSFDVSMLSFILAAFSAGGLFLKSH